MSVVSHPHLYAFNYDLFPVSSYFGRKFFCDFWKFFLQVRGLVFLTFCIIAFLFDLSENVIRERFCKGLWFLLVNETGSDEAYPLIRWWSEKIKPVFFRLLQSSTSPTLISETIEIRGKIRQHFMVENETKVLLLINTRNLKAGTNEKYYFSDCLKWK